MNSPGIRIRARLTQLETKFKALQELDPSATPGKYFHTRPRAVTTQKKNYVTRDIQVNV